MPIKNIIILVSAVVVIGGVGYGVYNASTSKTNDTTSNTTSNNKTTEKITGKQAEGKNVEVYLALIQPSPTNLSNDANIINAGYSAPVQITLHSGKKMAIVALEELHINNLNAVGDCTTSDKDESVGTYSAGIQQLGHISFKLTCRTGVTYTVESILATGSSFDSSELLSYGGLTPASLTRSLSFDVAVKFDDGTMTKKSFKGNISGTKLAKGDFGAGTLTGEGEKF